VALGEAETVVRLTLGETTMGEDRQLMRERERERGKQRDRFVRGVRKSRKKLLFLF